VKRHDSEDERSHDERVLEVGSYELNHHCLELFERKEVRDKYRHDECKIQMHGALRPDANVRSEIRKFNGKTGLDRPGNNKGVMTDTGVMSSRGLNVIVTYDRLGG
jgi:hypothetical protein